MEKDRINAHVPDRSRDRLTIAEAAALVGAHKNTVRNRIKAGIYKAEKVVTKRGPTYLIERQSLLNNLATNAQPRGSQELANPQAVAEFAQGLLSSFVEDTVAAREQLVTERTRRESAERERDELRQELRQ